MIQSVKKFLQTPIVQRMLNLFQYGMLIGIVIYLILELSKIGWIEVAENLPAEPLFYALFLARFFAIPVSEIPAYKLVWNIPLWRHLDAFIRKRIYNFAVVSYGGEAFFTLWARRNLNLDTKKILTGIKDNNILSAFASNVATVVLILIIVAMGDLQQALDTIPGATILFLLAFLSSLLLSAAVIFFHEKILDISLQTARYLTTIHGLRLLLVMVLQAAMYAVALPGGAFIAWLYLITLQLVLSRIPFLPNVDLIFLSLALLLSPAIGVSDAALAGVLVAEAGLVQILNFLLFFATAHCAKPNNKRLSSTKSEERISAATSPSTLQ
ncbi:MAG: hypothetical protein AAF720_13970 [Pseudomonadota bacterium]